MIGATNKHDSGLHTAQPAQKSLLSADIRSVRDKTGYESYFELQTLNTAGVRASRHAAVTQHEQELCSCATNV